ncbi:MAG: hypothetical protein U0790_07255 [Isosphaeraceae bacterium]
MLDALGAATKVIYPAEGYQPRMAEGARVEHSNTKVVALADLFQDRLDRAHGELPPSSASTSPGPAGLHRVRRLQGSALAIPDINYVILTPPHSARAHPEAGDRGGQERLHREARGGGRPRREVGGRPESWPRGRAWASPQAPSVATRRATSRRSSGIRTRDVATVYAKVNGTAADLGRRQGIVLSEMEWQLRNWNYFTGSPATTSSSSTSTTST